MKKSSISILCVLLLTNLTLFTSCNDEPDHAEFDCGMVETEVVEISHVVGSYSSSDFSSTRSVSYEEAAIALFIDDFRITTDTETNCASFSAIPQQIENISIKSSNNVNSSGEAFSSGQELTGLFKLHNQGETFSIAEFISAQNSDPLRFHTDGDEIVFQLLNQPDETIDQAFEVQITFDDSTVFTIEIPKFEVLI